MHTICTHAPNELTTHLIQRQGIFSVRAKVSQSKEFSDFNRTWYSQTSTATMSTDGTRTACSDAKDATGSYIWREDGLKDGRCFGIDFEQVAQKHSAGKCNDTDSVSVCEYTELAGFVPYAYDAAIALAHGLHKLVNNGVDPADMTASLVFEAIRSSSFKGATGQVSFYDNGDRRTRDLEYIVYNYQVDGDSHDFEDVGHVVNDKFVQCTDAKKCSPDMMFSDGTRHAPNVQRTVREAHCHALLPWMRVCRLAPPPGFAIGCM